MLAVRALQIAVVVLTAGVFVFQFLVVPRADREGAQAAGKELERWLRLVCVCGVVLAAVSWVLWLGLVAASMSGKAIDQALDVEILSAVLSGTTFGHVWLVRLGLLLLLAVALFA